MKPWLWLPPQLAHDLSPYGLKFLKLFSKGSTPSWNSFSWKHIHFENPLGIAGGVDKNGDSILEWQNLGCGFVEIGTVTPRPQNANPGKIMDRNPMTLSLWNKMGFPSAGMQTVVENLKQTQRQIPLFINLGKNRDTPNEKSHEDYIQLIQQFQNLADAFVINISSPNTKDLRDLVKPSYLEPFLQPLVRLNSSTPLLIKMSPDLSKIDLSEALRTCLNNGIDGFILTNTTSSRDNTPFYPQQGGVSGKPLKSLSLRALDVAQKVCAQEKTKKILISAGGVMTADDVFERIERGADLVQVYSTLIFEGPTFFRKVAKVAEHRINQKIAGQKELDSRGGRLS